jgi:glutathione transport system ATP-binding protein
VEYGTRRQIFENPLHAYTRQLLSAIPVADPAKRHGDGDLTFKPIPSPILPVGVEPGPSLYDEPEPGHRVLRQV